MIWGKSGLIELTKNRLKSVGSSREWSSGDLKLERAKGIEPSYRAWEALVLPLNYARKGVRGAL